MRVRARECYLERNSCYGATGPTGVMSEDSCDNEPADAVPMSLRSGLFLWRLRDNILHYVLPL